MRSQSFSRALLAALVLAPRTRLDRGRLSGGLRLHRMRKSHTKFSHPTFPAGSHPRFCRRWPHMSSRGPLSRASRPFTRSISNGSSGSRAVGRTANGDRLKWADIGPTRAAFRRTGVRAKADIPSRVRNRLYRPRAILGRLPHAAVTLKAASCRTGHNSNSRPSVGRSTPPPLSCPTKTFRLMKIGSLSPLQSRVD